MGKFLKELVLFLKDFCGETWTANRLSAKGLEAVRYPVTSVNSKTGDVELDAEDVGARPDTWTPTVEDVGALSVDGKAADASKLSGKTWAEMMLEIYPVGSIYISTTSTSPASLFGGTWEQLKDRFLLGAGGSYGAGSTGGEVNHALTVNEMPRHEHWPLNINNLNLTVWSGSGTGGCFHMDSLWDDNGPNNNTFGTGYAGGSQPHNNMPPYLAVYMWKRVS